MHLAFHAIASLLMVILMQSLHTDALRQAWYALDKPPSMCISRPLRLVPTLAQFAIYPLELVRTRLAVCPMGTYRGIWDCWGQIVRKEGWSCFYRGLTPSLVSSSWHHAIHPDQPALNRITACWSFIMCKED